MNIFNGFSWPIKATLIVIVLFITPILNTNIVGAYDLALDDLSQKKGLTLYPLRTELEIMPGTLIEGTLNIANYTDKPMDVDLNAEVFSVINQQYDYAFTEASDVVKWIDFRPSRVSLGIDESREIIYTVNVPLSSEPGGRYISLFASTDTKLNGNSISSRQRIASLLYITVSGEVTRSGHLISLSSPWLVSKETIWSAALRNSGSTHFRSRYSVKITDIFGNDYDSELRDEALVLPGTIRSISNKVPTPRLPGIYKVIYNIGLGDTPAKKATRYFVYVTPSALVLLLVVVTTGMYIHKNRREKEN